MHSPSKTPSSPRIHPWIALRASVKMLRNPHDLQAAADLALAVDGSCAERLFQRFAADPRGIRILEEQRVILRLLADRDYLASMPDGSLARAYLDWMDEQGFAAESLQALFEDPSCERGRDNCDHRLLVANRMRDLHDLWHVVTGYSRDLVGEAALMSFSYQQVGTRIFGLMLPLIIAYVAVRAPRALPLVLQAKRRARKADWFAVVDWEGLLHRPLHEVREELRVGPAPVYDLIPF